MSTYFFGITRNGQQIGDTDGLIFPDNDAVWEEAMTSSCEIIREMRAVEPGMNWQMEVTDEAGQPIYRIRFTAETIASPHSDFSPILRCMV